MLTHGREGLIVEPGRPHELARAIETLASDAPRRRRMGRAARERSRLFDMRVAAEKLSEYPREARLMTSAKADRPLTASIRRVREERRFVILGAGLTGLAVAVRLEELGEPDYLLVEKEERPGGWAKTDRSGSYAADRAIHVLYFRDAGVRRRVESLLEGRWIRHAKRCVVDSGGVRTPFPFHANLHGRAADVIAECLAGLWEVSLSRETPATTESFLDWNPSFIRAGRSPPFHGAVQHQDVDGPARAHDRRLDGWIHSSGGLPPIA